MTEQQILNQIQNLQNSLQEIKLKKRVAENTLSENALKELGFKESFIEEYESIFEKPINEIYYFWFQKLDGVFYWGVSSSDESEDIYVSESFADFYECLKDYLSNKDFYKIKTIKVTKVYDYLKN